MWCLTAVAFINAYNPDDRTACQVYNVATSHLASAGVGTIDGGSVSATEYFDLQGRRLAAPAQGITIKAERLSDGSIRTSKIIR